ncbi:MAG: sensor histidine kinase [Thermoplasmatota archaeon]
MAAKEPAVGTPPPTLRDGAERMAERDAARALPGVLFAVGLFYVLVSPVELLANTGPHAAALWGLAETVGLILLGAWAVGRRAGWSWPAARGMMIGAFALVFLQLALQGIWQPASSAGEATAILLLGAGFLFPSTALVMIIAAASAAIWIVLPAIGWLPVPHPVPGAPSIDLQELLVFAGAIGAVIVREVRAQHGIRSVREEQARVAEREELKGEVYRHAAQLQSLMEISQEMIVLADESERITFMNPAAEQAFGFGKAQGVGLALGALFETGEAQPLARRPSGATFEIVARKWGGGTFQTEVSITRTDTGRTLVILRDLSERNRAAAEAAVQRQQELELERLRTSNELKTRFLNSAAHELNTPLTPVRLQVHLLSEGALGPLNDKQAWAVQIADRNLVRLQELVNEVLDVARLQTGNLKLNVEPIEVETLIMDVWRDYEEVARNVGVHVLTQLTPGLYVRGDRARLRQVVQSLLSNALKFTPENGQVSLRTGVDKTQIVFEVADTGIGLAKGDIEKLFRPFSQVYDQRKFTRSGPGLGLYISKEILEAHGGTIVAESAGPGQGTVFRVSLPASTPPGRAPGAAEPEGQKAEAPEGRGEQMVLRLRELI